MTSFLIVNFSAIAALIVLGLNQKREFGFHVMRIILIGYVMKIIVGYLFWEYYMFPHYFSDPISHFAFAHKEYLITESWMKDIARERIAEGLFYIPPIILIIKHFALHYWMSNLYLSGSFNPFDIAVQNSLYSIYTAVLILAISKYLGATAKQMKYTLIIAVYQPFSMISSIIWRDVVGQFFVALGGYLTLLSVNKKVHVAIILLLIASFSMLMQRTLYFFFPTLAYVGYMMIKSKNKLALVFLPILIGAVIFVNNQLQLTEDLNTGYGMNLTSINLWIFLPVNIFKIFMGPFPWIQWFKFTDNTIFQIADYFQSVISISIVILCIKVFVKKRHLIMKKYPGTLLLLILFIPFIFAALGTEDIHQAYMTTAVIFLIPLLLLFFTYSSFNLMNLVVFMFFIFSNILFLSLGLYGAGVKDLFR
jgi:hypothetical protein